MVYGDGNIVSDVVREPEYAWSSGKGSVEYKTDLPLNDKNTYYAQISGGASGASISNKAYEGVYVEQGKEYKFSVWARKGSYSGDISVAVGNSIQGNEFRKRL